MEYNENILKYNENNEIIENDKINQSLSEISNNNIERFNETINNINNEIKNNEKESLKQLERIENYKNIKDEDKSIIIIIKIVITPFYNTKSNSYIDKYRVEVNDYTDIEDINNLVDNENMLTSHRNEYTGYCGENNIDV